MSRSDTKAPWHLWLVAILAIVWNAFGAADYTMSQLENRGWFEMMGFDEATTNAVLAWLADAPLWSHAAWALGVWGGLAGSLLLLLRNRLAVWAFLVSIGGVIASMIHQAMAVYPPELAEMAESHMMWGVLVIAAGLLLYSWWMRGKGVLA